MIHRQNWLDIRDYLRHCERIKQNDPATVSRYRKCLRHLLEWSGEIPLHKARSIDPTYPTYLLTARSDGKAIPLAPASMTKTLMIARQFFSFARSEWSHRYRFVAASWIESLVPPRHMRLESRLTIRQFYTLEDIVQLATVSAETLRQERAKVGACMLFLSGMRADALASLPISCVDLDNNQIMQLPELGVRTKNRKAAITYLLDIPELLAVVSLWDRRVRSLPSNALWYSTLSQDGMALTATTIAYNERHHVVERDLKIICQLAGLAYLSPHKLRHGHVVHALKQARNMAEMKAISQNIMHASTIITDQVYGKLIANDVQDIIGNLGKKRNVELGDQLGELLALLQQASLRHPQKQSE